MSDFIPFLVLGSGIGLVLAAVVFSISAFSMPLMLERQVDMMSAVFTSFNAVRNNIPAMVVWAILICMGVLFGFATYGIGMILTIPVLGFATWHGYQETIKQSHDL